MNVQIATSPAPDHSALKSTQQRMWESGDYSVVGTTLQIVGENLCEVADVRGGHRVLDVAAGNGNVSLAAARRFADVTSTDYVSSLLERGRERAAAERLEITFRVADCENLPFDDGAFDHVLSTFGVMFAQDHEKTARELVRVCRKGGRIALANWIPDGFVGQMFRLVGRYAPPPQGIRSPALWGAPDHLGMLFGTGVTLACVKRTFTFRYRSPEHWLLVFRSCYGPLLTAFSSLDATGRAGLERDLLALVAAFNAADDGSVVIPGDYLEAVGECR